MTTTDVDGDDYLDGCCDLDFDMGPPVPDDEVVWVVLFATVLDGDLRVRDRAALARRAREWHELFDRGP